MLRHVFIASFYAVAVMAAPTTNLLDHDGEVVLYKRDDVLDARDLELADLHGVDLDQMYRHSLLKRDDGDHVTIWVNHNYTAEEPTSPVEDEESLAKREPALRLAKTANYVKDTFSDHCYNHKRQDHTGPNAPTTAGVEAIENWARGQSAHSFKITEIKKWQNLVIAGSNGGANALYRAKLKFALTSTIGTQDLRNDAEWTHDRRRQFDGKWRASSKGGETCSDSVRVIYELIRTKYNV